MNKFLPQTGGHLLTSDDLTFLQDSFSEGFQSMISALSDSPYYIIKDPNFINLDGSNPPGSTNGYITWGDGYVSALNKDGNIEIFHIPASTNTTKLEYNSLQQMVLFLQLITDNSQTEGQLISPSPVIYKNKSTKIVHFKRELKLVYIDATSGFGYGTFSSMTDKTLITSSDWSDIIKVGDYIYNSNFPIGTIITAKSANSITFSNFSINGGVPTNPLRSVTPPTDLTTPWPWVKSSINLNTNNSGTTYFNDLQIGNGYNNGSGGTIEGNGVYFQLIFQKNQSTILKRLSKIENMLAPLIGYTSTYWNGSNFELKKVFGSYLFWGRPAIEIPEGWEPVPDSEWQGRIPLISKNANYKLFTATISHGGTTGTFVDNGTNSLNLIHSFYHPKSVILNFNNNPKDNNNTDINTTFYNYTTQIIPDGTSEDHYYALPNYIFSVEITINGNLYTPIIWFGTTVDSSSGIPNFKLLNCYFNEDGGDSTTGIIATKFITDLASITVDKEITFNLIRTNLAWPYINFPIQVNMALINGKGGEESHILTSDQVPLPTHDHIMHGKGLIPIDGVPSGYLNRNSSRYSGSGGSSEFGATDSIDTEMRTGDSLDTRTINPISNVQPFQTVLFIRYVGDLG